MLIFYKKDRISKTCHNKFNKGIIENKFSSKVGIN